MMNQFTDVCVDGPQSVNSLTPGRYGNNFKSMISKLFMQKSSWDTHCEIAVR